MAKRTAQEAYEYLADLAEDLFSEDQGDNKERWLNDHMKAMGFRAKLSWDDAEPDDGKVSEGYFGSGRKSREIERRPPREKSTEKNWLYG